MILFQAAPDKIVQATTWLSDRNARSLPERMTALFLADAFHLRDWGRPVTGDIWDAGPWGPVGRAIHALASDDPYAWSFVDPAVTPQGDPGRAFQRLSGSDVEVLQQALDQVVEHGHDAFHRIPHLHEAWAASYGGPIDAALLFPPHERDRRSLEDLASTALFKSL